MGSDREYSQTLNQLLVELDGFDKSLNSTVVVMAATNRFRCLDEALTRPGRLGDRVVHVPLPNTLERLEILKILSKRVKCSENLVSSFQSVIVPLTNNYSGADLKLLLDRAAIRAKREGLFEVELEVVLEELTLMEKDRAEGVGMRII